MLDLFNWLTQLAWWQFIFIVPFLLAALLAFYLTVLIVILCVPAIAMFLQAVIEVIEWINDQHWRFRRWISSLWKPKQT